MFEYERSYSIPRWAYVAGTCVLLGCFGINFLVLKVHSVLGAPAAALVPGTVPLLATGVLYVRANRKLDALTHARGLVQAVALYPREPYFKGEKIRSRTHRAGLEVRFDLLEGGSIVVETEGNVWNRPGDDVVMLYEAGEPEAALILDHWRGIVYKDCLVTAGISLLLLLQGWVVLWLMN